jgi:hypothetical protein
VSRDVRTIAPLDVTPTGRIAVKRSGKFAESMSFAKQQQQAEKNSQNLLPRLQISPYNFVSLMPV